MEIAKQKFTNFVEASNMPESQKIFYIIINNILTNNHIGNDGKTNYSINISDKIFLDNYLQGVHQDNLYELIWLLEKNSPVNAKKIKHYLSECYRAIEVDNFNTNGIDVANIFTTFHSKEIKEFMQVHSISSDSLYYSKALVVLSEIASRNKKENKNFVQSQNLINAIMQNGELGLESLSLLEKNGQINSNAKACVDYINSISNFSHANDSSCLQQLLDYREFASSDKNIVDALEKYGL